jgi:hypothetical protein
VGLSPRCVRATVVLTALLEFSVSTLRPEALAGGLSAAFRSDTHDGTTSYVSWNVRPYQASLRSQTDGAARIRSHGSVGGTDPPWQVAAQPHRAIRAEGVGVVSHGRLRISPG